MAKMPERKPGRSEQSVATPPEFLAKVKEALGIRDFNWDFAADASNTVTPHGHYDEAQNALDPGRCWEKRIGVKGWGWLNPPYANIGPWVERCVETSEAGGHMALLVPASVGANWFRDYVDQKAHILLLNGRLTFVGHTAPYPKDLILCLYGPRITPEYRVWDWKNTACPL